MKILGISAGSKNGNNDAICKEALMGAAECGAEVEFIRLLDLELKPCTGCNACLKSLNAGGDGACPIKDDFEWLREKVLDADGIVFSVPVFEKGAAGVFHIILDRFGPRHDRGTNTASMNIARESGGTGPDLRVLRDKPVAFLGMGGTNYTSRFQCDCAMLAAHLMWTVVENKVYNWTKVFAMEDEKVAHAHQTGIRLAHAAADLSKAKYYGDQGMCPHCHSRNFYLNDQAPHAVCCLCGIEGELKIENGKMRFEFAPDQLCLASDTMEGKLHHAADIKSNQAVRMAMRRSDTFQERQQKYIHYLKAFVPDR